MEYSTFTCGEDLDLEAAEARGSRRSIISVGWHQGQSLMGTYKKFYMRVIRPEA